MSWGVFVAIASVVAVAIAIGLGVLSRKFARPMWAVLLIVPVLTGLLLWFNHDAEYGHVDELDPGALSWGAGTTLVLLASAAMVRRRKRWLGYVVAVVGALLVIELSVIVSLRRHDDPPLPDDGPRLDPDTAPWWFWWSLTDDDRLPWTVGDFFSLVPYLFVYFSGLAIVAVLSAARPAPRPVN